MQFFPFNNNFCNISVGSVDSNTVFFCLFVFCTTNAIIQSLEALELLADGLSSEIGCTLSENNDGNLVRKAARGT